MVGNGTEDETSFPVLVYISNAAIKSGTNVFNSSGSDILAFTDSGCTNQMPSELDSYDNTNGILYLWVNVASLSHTTNQTFYICMGNYSPPARLATGMWDANFYSVTHLRTTSAPALDLTNSNNAVHSYTWNKYNGDTYGTGMFGGGSVVPSGGLIQAAAAFPQATSAGISFSAWFKSLDTPSGSNEADWVVDVGNSSGALGFHINDAYIGKLSLVMKDSGSTWHGQSYTGAYTPGNWYYVSGSWDGTSVLSGYINNNPLGATGVTSIWNYQAKAPAFPASTFAGTIDEVRLSIAARSQGWFSTEYLSGSNPGNIGAPGFLTAGSWTINPILGWSGCPSSGTNLAASSTCTVTIINGTFDGVNTITLTDADATTGVSNYGTFTVTGGGSGSGVGSVTFAPTNGGTSFTFTYTPQMIGPRYLSMTTTALWGPPSYMTYTVAAIEHDTFTAKASGEWNAAGTWTCSGTCGHGYPISGDSVVVAGYNVTCGLSTPQLCLVGQKPANNSTYDIIVSPGASTGVSGTVEVTNGSVLLLTGNLMLNNLQHTDLTRFGVLKLDTGATFLMDEAYGATVYRGISSTSGDWNQFIIGTAGNTCTWSANYTYSCPTKVIGIDTANGVYPTPINTAGLYDNYTVQAYGTQFSHLGAAAVPAIEMAGNNGANGYTAANTLDVEGSVFDTTLPAGPPPSNYGCGLCTYGHLTWKNNREINNLAAWAWNTPDISTWASNLTSCQIVGNYFKASPSTVQPELLQGCTIQYNMIDSPSWFPAGNAGQSWALFDSNILVTTSAQNNDNAPGIGYSRIYMYYSAASGSASRHMGPALHSASFVMSGNIGDTNASVNEGYCNSVQGTSDTSAFTMKSLDNLSVMSAALNNACAHIYNVESIVAGAALYLDHNGANGATYPTAYWISGGGHPNSYYPTNAIYQSVRANLGYDPVAGHTWDFIIGDYNDALGGTASNVVGATSIIDWNAYFNQSSNSLYSGNFAGTAYQLNSVTASVGPHEKPSTNPYYIDVTRRLDTWASRVMGQQQSYAGAQAALWGCPSLMQCISGMYAWVRQGYQPTNMALKGVAHDGKIVGFNTLTAGSGYSGTCGVTITPQDQWDLGGATPAYTASATCSFAGGGVPVVTLVNGGAHYRIATPAAVAITCGGCTPAQAAVLTPIIAPSDIGPVPMYQFASVAP
jgi:hypothetical protein